MRQRHPSTRLRGRSRGFADARRALARAGRALRFSAAALLLASPAYAAAIEARPAEAALIDREWLDSGLGAVFGALGLAEPSGLAAAALGAIALALGLAILAYVIYGRAAAKLETAESELARHRDRSGRLERLLAAEPGGAYLYPPGGGEPMARGAGRQALATLLAGPAGLKLATALENLQTTAQGFTLELRGDDGEYYEAVGRPAGGGAALWLRPLKSGESDAPRAGSEAEIAYLKAERDGLMALIDAIPLPVWRRKADLTLDFANRAYAEAAGAADPEGAIAQQAALDRREAALAREALSSGAPLREKRYIVQGGQRRALLLTETPAGSGVAGVALDVTPLEEAEARLKRHVDAHDETLDKLKTAVAVFDADQRLSFYNRAFAELFAFEPAWLDTHPSDGEVLERLRAARRLPEQRDFLAWKRERLSLYTHPQALEEYWHLPDDTTIRMMAQPHPLGGLLFLYDDVTNELALERRYNTLITTQKETLDSLSEGIAAFGPNGRLQLFNAAFARLWGFSSAQLEGNPHFSDIAKHCRPLLRDTKPWDAAAAHVTGLTTERRGESFSLERLDGQMFAGAAVPLPDGATLLSFANITDTVRAEERLIERNQALEAANRLKNDFVAHVSRQLRNPLNPIVGYAEILQQGIAGPMSERQSEYLSHIAKGASQLRALVNDILDLAYGDAGQLELELADIDVRETLQSVLPLVAERAQQSGIVIAFECADDAGRMTGDPKRIRQAVYNVIANALDFTPPGGEVRLSARGEGAGVVITVSDTGPGIPADYLPRAFERFESRAGPGKRGAGLGLALVKSFVELHGGWVALESETGKGTTVTLRLPRQPQPAIRKAG